MSCAGVFSYRCRSRGDYTSNPAINSVLRIHIADWDKEQIWAITDIDEPKYSKLDLLLQSDISERINTFILLDITIVYRSDRLYCKLCLICGQLRQSHAHAHGNIICDECMASLNMTRAVRALSPEALLLRTIFGDCTNQILTNLVLLTWDSVVYTNNNDRDYG